MAEKMISISISTDLHQKLLEMKEEAKEKWQLYINGGWTKKEIMEETFVIRPTFDGIISDLFKQIENLNDTIDYISHCHKCCTCDECSEVRRIRRQEEAEEQEEEAAQEKHFKRYGEYF